MPKFSNINVIVPDIDTPYSYYVGKKKYSYSDSSLKNANIAMIKRINSNYGTTIAYWGTVFEIPKGIIIGFIATESGGTMAPPNIYKATGLMQVTPDAVFDPFVKWKSEVKMAMPAEAIAEMNKKCPELVKAPFGSLMSSALRSKILLLLQTDASFNVLAGTICLRWLLERFSNIISGGQLNKAMVAYNGGAYLNVLATSGGGRGMAIDSTTLATNPKVPSESRSYLYKLLGVDGYLSLIYKDKVIV